MFLGANLSKNSMKSKSILGVGDAKLAGSISELIEVSCMHYRVVPEIMRGLLATLTCYIMEALAGCVIRIRKCT